MEKIEYARLFRHQILNVMGAKVRVEKDKRFVWRLGGESAK